MTTDPRLQSGGILPIDKPGGITSHDVVASIRKQIRPLRVGHTGTLDPLATGLLILCVGAATRITDFIEERSKTYRAVALLGVQTDTQDISGEVLAETSTVTITEEGVRDAARSFLGAIEQRPPAFSAVKVGGVRAYKLARRHQEVSMEPRRVDVRRFEIERVDLPKIQLLVECSKGTYVRTLCHDLGEKLGVGGCMQSLRRLAIGDLGVSRAKPLVELDCRETIIDSLLPASEALAHLPAIVCDEKQAARVTHGMTLEVTGQLSPSQNEGWTQVLGPEHSLLAMGKVFREGDKLMLHPKRVLVQPGYAQRGRAVTEG